MLYPMERKVGKYVIEVNGFVMDWIWYLIPTIEIAFDDVFVGVRFHFLCFDLSIDVTNQKKFDEWEQKLKKKMEVFNPYDYD